MSPRSEPPFRSPNDELAGFAGCLVFCVFLVCETAVAGLAGIVSYFLARSEPVDVGHEIGIALSLIGGIAALLWIDRHCRRMTGHSAGEIACEFLFLWW